MLWMAAVTWPLCWVVHRALVAVVDSCQSIVMGRPLSSFAMRGSFAIVQVTDRIL